jgi:glycine/D-amino acid oxidase-like deaminating enzyme
MHSYDVIIIGGGGHGLATAYYLAKNHGIRNIAILEKGYIGSGNVGRNTTIVRSNYMMQDNTAFYEHSMSLWRGRRHPAATVRNGNSNSSASTHTIRCRCGSRCVGRLC